MYVVPSRPKTEFTNVVIIGMILVCRQSAFDLFDPRYTYSYVSDYYAQQLELSWDSLSMPVYIFTPVGDSLVVD